MGCCNYYILCKLSIGTWTWVPDGNVEHASLSVDGANALLEAARKALEASGLPWEREPLKLKAAPKLTALVKRSRELAAAGVGGEENA